MIKGKQSILFDRHPYIVSNGSIVGNKESEGPLGDLFDEYDKSDLFGQQTWELAESKMQQRACEIALAKAGKTLTGYLDEEVIRYIGEHKLYADE